MSLTAEPYERHLVCKTLTRVLFKLEAECRPYAARVLVVALPMLLEEDAIVRTEGRELVSNLAKAVGQPTIISTLRPLIESNSERERAAVARAMAVCACSFGLGSFLPFLSAVCLAKKHELARLAGARAIRHLSLFLSSGVLPHLKKLVPLLKGLIEDDSSRVRLAASTATSALATAANPFGGETVEMLVPGLWKGLNAGSGKGLSIFLRALSATVRLLEPTTRMAQANMLLSLLEKEADNIGDENLRKTATEVLGDLCQMEGMNSRHFVPLLDIFFDKLWMKKAASERVSAEQLEKTGVGLTRKVGLSRILP